MGAFFGVVAHATRAWSRRLWFFYVGLQHAWSGALPLSRGIDFRSNFLADCFWYSLSVVL